MDPVTIISLAIAFVSMITGVYMAFVKRKEKLKREAKERENEELREEQKIVNEKLRMMEEIKDSVQNELNKTLDEMCDKTHRGFVTKEQLQTLHNSLEETVNTWNKSITSKLDQMIHVNDKSEAKYIRYVIVQFADDLRNGRHRSDVAYKNILEYYDYYKNYLHQNSYVDDEIAFIKERMKERE